MFPVHTLMSLNHDWIADDAAMKRHQRLDELLIFYPHYKENQQRCLQENSVRNPLIYDKSMLYETCAYLAC